MRTKTEGGACRTSPFVKLAKVIIRLQDFNDLTKEEWLEARAECRRLKNKIEELR